jgi:hypothetical protein
MLVNRRVPNKERKMRNGFEIEDEEVEEITFETELSKRVSRRTLLGKGIWLYGLHYIALKDLDRRCNRCDCNFELGEQVVVIGDVHSKTPMFHWYCLDEAIEEADYLSFMVLETFAQTFKSKRGNRVDKWKAFTKRIEHFYKETFGIKDK